MQNLGRRVDKHSTEHDKQEYGERQQHLRRATAEILPHKLGQVAATIAHGEHASEIVVNGSGENAAEDNPQIRSRTKLGTHDGTKDGTCAGDVEKLYHEHFPVGHGDIVHAVGLCHGWRGTVIGREYAFHEAAIYKIAHNKGSKRDKECYHYTLFLVIGKQLLS